MRTTTTRMGETLMHVAARTIGGSSFTDLAAYIQAIAALNSTAQSQPTQFAPVVDWTALAPQTPLRLPD